MKNSIIFLAILAALFTSCNNETTLQEYYVNNQEDKDFIAVDIPASLMANAENLSLEEKKTMETIKKINLLAVPNKKGNEARIQKEKSNITDILKDEKYQLLMKYGSDGTNVEIYFTGKEEAIDEVIVYGFDENKGVGIARVLGDKMNPADIMKLMKSMEKGGFNLGGLKQVAEAMGADVPEVIADSTVTENAKMKTQESLDSVK